MNLDELLRLAIVDSKKRGAFIKALIQSNVFVICKHPVKKDDDCTKLEIVTTRNPDGEIFVPFFTSYKSMQYFAKRYVEYYEINCLRLFEYIQDASAVLNPNSYGKEFSSQEMKNILTIANGLKIRAISMHTEPQVVYEKPATTPYHITKPAAKFFAKHENVDRAFIMTMKRGVDKPQILLVIDMIGSRRKLYVSLSRALSKCLKNGEGLSFITYDEDAEKKILMGSHPFYVRKKENLKDKIFNLISRR